MATTQFTFTQSAGTSAKKFTVSMWWKPGTISTAQGLWGCGTGTSDAVSIHYTNADKLSLETFDGSLNPKLETNRLFRDPSAWYHLVFSIDTTDSDADERLKIWINGVEETSFTTDTTITQDSDIPGWSAASDVMKIGNRWLDGDAYFDGLMAHVHVIDGTIYAASAFGETDSTSGIWVAKTSPSVTYGTNGGFYKFVSGALTTDSSGESNTLTSVGTPTTTKDTPDNNFATLNSVYPSNGFTSQSPTWSNGNNTFATSNASSQWGISPSTIGLSTGKWYAECKISATSGETLVGILSSNWGSNTYLGLDATDYGYYAGNGEIRNDGGTAYGNSYTAGDIIGIYLDLDNNKLYFGKNGTIQNSGTGFSITAPASTDKGLYLLAAQEWNSSGNGTFQWNFGNGYFGTTAVSSGVADAGGEGTFEYDPSSGTFDGSSKDFRAICTANLATYG